MDSSNCLSYKRLIILHKLRCANCVTKILYFFHTTKLSVPVFSNFCLHTDFLFCPELSNYRIFVFTRNIADGHGFSFSFLVPNFRIIEFCLHTEYRGQSRIFCHELSNFNHTDSHGVSLIFFFFFLSRIIETCPWTH